MECFKTFRKAPPSQLIMTLLVKNEESMLEENLLFHKAMGVDSFIITDNNSTDSTPEIIRKYKQKGWIKEVIEEKATDYEQKEWVDRMIWKAKTIYKADWIINADADELWYSPSGNLKTDLSATHANVLNCEMRSVYPEENQPFWQWDKVVKPVSEPERYDLSTYSIFERQNKKVIHRSAGYTQISMGNHKVTMLPQLSTDSGIRIYHYNIRGKQQFLEKMINGGSIKADMEVAIGDTSTNYTKKGNSKRSMTGLSGKKTMMYSITTDLFIRILPYRIFTNKSTKNKLLV
mgnify:CR=1 FL=1